MKKVNLWDMKGVFACQAKWPNQTTGNSVTEEFQIIIQGDQSNFLMCIIIKIC